MLALHLFTIVLVAVMVGLGFWQLDRHNERATFNDAVRARAQVEPRSPDEVLRVLDALQTDELCPCNWQKGEDTLKAA